MDKVIGVDASRNRSGGAVAHLVGLLRDCDPRDHGVDRVHVWSYRELLAAVPDAPWLVKHAPPQLDGSVPAQLWWQYRSLPREARIAGCDLMFNTDAGSVCPFSPSVVMSQDMLSYEPREMRRFGWSLGRLRLLALRAVQTKSMRRADAVIFLTDYASRTIQRSIGPVHSVVIPLGVGGEFRSASRGRARPADSGAARCLYVSNALPYKHPWNVVEAVGDLRRRGRDISLLLVGGGSGRAQKLLDAAIERTDPKREFVTTLGFLRHAEIPGLLAAADVFVFASSCESMPVTLVEAMANGAPIACSDRGPMPEILADGGVYFDPEDPVSIAAAIDELLLDDSKRVAVAERALSLADRYSWGRCARETWALLAALVDETRRKTARRV